MADIHAFIHDAYIPGKLLESREAVVLHTNVAFFFVDCCCIRTWRLLFFLSYRQVKEALFSTLMGFGVFETGEARVGATCVRLACSVLTCSRSFNIGLFRSRLLSSYTAKHGCRTHLRVARNKPCGWVGGLVGVRSPLNGQDF